MSAILHAADELIGRGASPALAADLLPVRVRQFHEPFVDEIGIPSVDLTRLAEFVAAGGEDLDSAIYNRTCLLDSLLSDIEHDLRHATLPRQQRRALERQQRELTAAIEREQDRLIRAEIAAVFRLETAEDMLRDAPKAVRPAETVTLAEAEAATRAAIESAVHGEGPRHVLIRAAAAVGKTFAATTIASEIARQRRDTRNAFIQDWRLRNPFRPFSEATDAAAKAGHRLLRVLYLAETHELIAQTVVLARASGMTSEHLGGMLRTIDPADLTSPPACTEHERVKQTREAGESVPDKACGRGTDGPRCPGLGGCRHWQRWRNAAHAEFVGMPVDTATQLYLAGELRGFDLIIVDETADRAIYGQSFVPLDNLSDRHFAAHPVRGADGEADAALTEEARAGYRIVRDAFDAAPDGYAPTVDPGLLARLIELTEPRDTATGIHAGTPATERAELARASFRRPVRGLCGMFRQMIAGPGFVRAETEDNDRRVAVVRTIRHFHPSMLDSRILVLDASAKADEWRRVLPDLTEIAVPTPKAEHETAVQIVLPMGKRAMESPSRMATARAIATLYATGETGVLTHMAHADAFADIGPVGWFGALAGVNRFEHVRTMLTFGLPSLSSEGAAYEGAGRTGEAVPVEMPRRVLRPVWMKDGTARLVPSMEFSHPAAIEAQEAWRERQAIQGPGGRPRAIRRTASTPVLSLYVGTTPIPNIRMDAVIRGPADLASERSLRMIADGFAFQSATTRHRLLPEIYPREWTADYDIARERGDARDAQAAFLSMMRRVIAPSWHPGQREAWAVVRWWRDRSQGNRQAGELAASRVCDLAELKAKLRTIGATRFEVIADIQPKAMGGAVPELDRSPQRQDDSWVLPTSWRRPRGNVNTGAGWATGPPDG